MTSPAHGTGVLTRHASGQVLDVWYPDPQLGEPAADPRPATAPSCSTWSATTTPARRSASW